LQGASMEPDHAILRAYLLGELSPADRQNIEELYFADDGYFELVAACEEEMLRDYLRGELTEKERRSVQQKYLATSEGRARLQFAAELMDAGKRSPAFSPRAGIEKLLDSWRQFWRRPNRGVLLAVAFTLVIGLGIAVEMQVLHRGSKLKESRAGGAGAGSVASLPSQLSLLSFRLSPDLERDAKAGVKLLLIPSSSAAQSPTVRLHLDLEPGQRVGRYRASLANRAGGAAWDGAAMRAAAEGFVEIDVPSAVLADGDYILTLDQDPAGAAHESYVFRVQRKP